MPCALSCSTGPCRTPCACLSQHGLCLHAWRCLQADEAEQEARLMIGIYEDLARNYAAIPVVAGRKSRIESFAGANITYTIEGMMGDRRALQVRAN